MRNPDRRQQAEMRRQSQLSGPASARNTPMEGGAGGFSGGGNETTGTLDWRPAGISNITSTGDPFYSAPG